MLERRADYSTSLWSYPKSWAHNIENAPKHRTGRPATTWMDDKQNYNLWRLLCSLDIAPAAVYEDKPEGYNRGPVPTHPVWRENLFILSNSCIPIAIQLASYLLFPDKKWSWPVAFGIYYTGFVYFVLSAIRRMHYYMVYYGTFDEGSKSRDIVGDTRVDKLGWTIFFAITVRVAGVFALGWDQNELPHGDIWTLPKIGLWAICLDYFFYVYHRSCHQVDFLWFVHRTHHSTRHPTPIMTILADDIQDSLEICLIPLLASFCVPLRFHEQYIAGCYLIYVEAMGHSGIRAYWPHPIIGHVLKPLEMELAVEDHDLHHRYGRNGKNYGKQSRIWDRIFGTIADREEADTLSVKDDLAPEAKQEKEGEKLVSKENGGDKEGEKAEAK